MTDAQTHDGEASGPQTRPIQDRNWFSFEDPDGTTWMFDLTFLLSEWTCVFGRGCHGVRETDASADQQGCCSFGAHFSDKQDRTTTLEYAARLGPDVWQNYGAVNSVKDTVAKDDDGDWTTIVYNDACIFHNTPDFEGGGGCALHSAALTAHERPLDWKPEVCWQLPLRLVVTTDENDHSTYTLRAWQRKDWGDSGDDFYWWCTDDGQAQAAQRPTYLELAEEIAEMIGQDRFDRLADYLRAASSPTTMLGNSIGRRPRD